MSTAARLFAAVAVAALLLPTTALAQEADGPTITTHVVESFDGEPIVTHLFLPAGASDDAPVPLVLRTHGWGGTGETAVGGTLEVLLDHGYAVLTWDQRGFGCSGGQAEVDKPEFEGRDASTLIDWAIANAPIATEDGDALVAFTGGSYAGGIQTATSSLDPRIDAIAPEISWVDLRYSLYSGQVPNQGWASLLYAAGQATASSGGLSPDCPGFAEYGPQEGSLNPIIAQSFVVGASTATLDDQALQFFADSSLAHYGQATPVSVPTLVMNGSVDTLFDLTDGWGVYEHVAAQGVPARFVAFCGGHVACPANYVDANDRDHLDEAIIAWFDRHVRGDETVDTGPAIEYRTNDGEWRSAPDFPTSHEAHQVLSGGGDGSLVSVPSVEVPDPGALADQLASAGGGLPATPLTAAQPSPDDDPRAYTVEVAAADDGPLELFGIPEVTLSVSGVGSDVTLFAKFVDREQGQVVNLQEGPISVPLGDEEVTVDVPMSGLAYTLPEGHHLDLQVATASLMHINARTPAQVDVSVVAFVPVVAAAPEPVPDTEPGADTEPDPAPVPDPAPDPTGAAAATPDPPLPVTGAHLPLLLPLGAVVVAATRRRRDG